MTNESNDATPLINQRRERTEASLLLVTTSERARTRLWGRVGARTLVWTLGAHQARCVETEEMCCVEFVRAQTSLPPQTGASALTLHTAPVYSSTIQLPIQLPHTAPPYSSTIQLYKHHAHIHSHWDLWVSWSFPVDSGFWGSQSTCKGSEGLPE